MSKKYSKAAAGTFTLNKKERIHRWYSYLEGYSSCLIEDLIKEVGVDKIQTIYDPFCGTGTTSLVASKYGIASYYSETNPFMQKVIEAKVNSVRRLRISGVGSSQLSSFLSVIKNYNYQLSFDKIGWNGFEKFFEDDVLRMLLAMKAEVEKITDGDTRNIALVCLASITVRASKMIRQGDLRVAKDSEKSNADRDVLNNFIQKIEEAIEDIDSDDCPTLSETTCLAPDARDIDAESIIDCVITSPPYLNGTNYIRNTKLELKLTGCVDSEKELPEFHSKGIIAGINNVSKRKDNIKVLECVQPYIDKLKPVAYDKRIPFMVAGYFQDMDIVIDKLSHVLKDQGTFIMDIGDSQFAGVHIPTHEVLSTICKNHGFELYDEEVLRKRRSKNGMVLLQCLLKFTLHKKGSPEECFKNEAVNFIDNMPYRQEPYSGRNWGHPWHSLCSYHGKLKPAIAHFMINQFTNPGDVILDPLCGVGTIPFEACLQGRVGVGNDLSELAYVVTLAKLQKPTIDDCLEVLSSLDAYIQKGVGSKFIEHDIDLYNNFGFNGKLSAYFHPDTYKEILCARRYFIPKIKSSITPPEAMVFSCFLHVLHGNRPYALSRNSHPLTPYAPRGEFIYKNVVEHIKDKLMLSYNKGTFEHYINGNAIYGDYNNLKNRKLSVDAIICSPPFADSIRFYTQNWMRLWLCGWESEDYKNAETLFLDQKQKKDFNVYESFFEMCAAVLKPHGKVILHLGKTDKVDMAEELSKRAKIHFTEVYRGSENVQKIEKHGIKDKGATVEHQYLFLMKKD
ncbi:MAG: DNA methyltransferase [Lactobacillus iners]|nr:DNA methyltransferase [Lactobacillus iners]